jgi:hypothetical protein
MWLFYIVQPDGSDGSLHASSLSPNTQLLVLNTMKIHSKARINAKLGAKAKKQQVHQPLSPEWDINS